MKFIDKIYNKYWGNIISEKEAKKFQEQSEKMITPCGKIFEKSDTSSVVISGMKLMASDGFHMIFNH